LNGLSSDRFFGVVQLLVVPSVGVAQRSFIEHYGVVNIDGQLLPTREQPNLAVREQPDCVRNANRAHQIEEQARQSKPYRRRLKVVWLAKPGRGGRVARVALGVLDPRAPTGLALHGAAGGFDHPVTVARRARGVTTTVMRGDESVSRHRRSVHQIPAAVPTAAP
jgi:hypothetical protein